jgi:hypothetical protein
MRTNPLFRANGAYLSLPMKWPAKSDYFPHLPPNSRRILMRKAMAKFLKRR